MRKITASSVLAAFLAGLPSAINGTGKSSAPTQALVVTSYEYTFQAPDSIVSGVVTVRLVNRGKIGHQLALARLDDSSSLTRVMQSLVADKEHTGGVHWSWRSGRRGARRIGGINCSTRARPLRDRVRIRGGQRARARVDGDDSARLSSLRASSQSMATLPTAPITISPHRLSHHTLGAAAPRPTAGTRRE